MHNQSPALDPMSAILYRATQAAFGKPLVTNVHRGLLAEAIVAEALLSDPGEGPAWHWCSADYASWDFERADGVKLEVKQSAATQSWTGVDGKPSKCSFDIKARTGRWENSKWIASPGRASDVYVFAHHPVEGDGADHREPGQWRLFVVPTAQLPTTQSISLARLTSMAQSVGFTELASAVAARCPA